MTTKHDHPIFTALQAAADGHPPTPKQIDDLVDELAAGSPEELTTAQRRQLRDGIAEGVRRASDFHAVGARGQARQSAESMFQKLAAGLPGWRRTTEPEDPRELAGRIPR